MRFVLRSNRPGTADVELAAASTHVAVAEAKALLPVDPDTWARIDDRWVAAGWSGLTVPAAWNVTLPPHGTHQTWVERISD